MIILILNYKKIRGLSIFEVMIMFNVNYKKNIYKIVTINNIKNLLKKCKVFFILYFIRKNK